jgi:hypothetical protein
MPEGAGSSGYFCERHIPTTLPGVEATIAEQSVREATDWSDLQARIMSRTRRGLRCGEAEARTYFCGSTWTLPKITSSPVRVVTRHYCNALILQTMSLIEVVGREIPANTRSLAVKAFADGVTSFFELRKSNPRAQMPGYQPQGTDFHLRHRQSVGGVPEGEAPVPRRCSVGSDEVGRFVAGACDAMTGGKRSSRSSPSRWRDEIPDERTIQPIKTPIARFSGGLQGNGRRR